MAYRICFTLNEKNIHANETFIIGNKLAIVTKCSILDVARVLNPPQYAPTRTIYMHGLHIYKSNLIQLPDKR